MPNFLSIQEPAPLPTKRTELAIGIDFGTTNSLVAFSRNQQPFVIADKLIPSQLGLDANTKIIVGQGKIKSLKRLIGKSLDEIIASPEISPHVKEHLIEEDGVIKIKLGYQYLTLIEAISKILLELKHLAEEVLCTTIEKAVITVPAYFDDVMRNNIKGAAQLAGLTVLRLINEPTAAAYAYGLENSAEGLYLVYDLGGGTFDVSLLNMQMGVFQVLATAGNNSLGGDDIDHIIFELLLKQLSNDVTLTFTELHEVARIAKETLSHTEIYTNSELECQLSRKQLEKAITPLINKTIALTKSVLAKTTEPIQGIILVGGSTRIPLITKLLSECFATPVFNNVDPDRVVALGAALQAENLSHNTNGNLLLDVTPLSLGLEMMGGMVEKIILRNTPLPCSARKSFTTYADKQTAMQFNIVQGEREMVADCRSLAKFELKNIPPMNAGLAKVQVDFEIDADGILAITAKEETTGQSQLVTLRPSYGLSQEQICKMLEDAYSNAEFDHNQKLWLELKASAERQLHSLNIAIADSAKLISNNELELLKQQMTEVMVAIETKNSLSLEQNLSKLDDISQNFVELRLNHIVENLLKGKKIDNL